MKRKAEDQIEPVASVPETSEQTKSKPEATLIATPATATPAATTSAPTAEPTFADLGLDPRLVQAIAKQKFEKPTLVQRTAIPLALDGQDVLAKAKTGSGKTLAYILPVLQSILKRKQTDTSAYVSALILVPTRELADQVFKVIETFTAFCAKDIQTVKLTDKVSDAVQRSLLSNNPDIVISTPARAWSSINSSTMSVDKLTNLVLDEADLVLSYGYDEDLENISKAIPKGVQAIMMSATLTAEVDTLKGLFCRNPKLLNLEEKDEKGEGVKQFIVKTAEDEKFLLAYVIFKLQLIKGKCIIFVADVDRCYRLRLFFEQFGLRSTILNSELPVNSRIHVVEEFNSGVYDILIASDENDVVGDEDEEAPKPAEEEEKKEEAEPTEAKDGEKEQKRPKKKRKTVQRDKEYGVSRGIDFKNVACVINFDLPTSSKSYTHRIGRTARAGNTGMALSFYVPEDQYRKHMPTSIETAAKDEKVLAKIVKHQKAEGKEVKPYIFDMNQVEPFRYRMNDALRAVTKVAIREARTRELRQELLKSEKLKRHFEENPGELHHLRHDGELRAARTQPHLRHIPDYLLPKEGKKAITAQQLGFVPLVNKDRKVRGKKFKGKLNRPSSFKGKKSDPLKSFKGRRK